MVKINELENNYQIALAIFDDFELNQSCTIKGFEKGPNGRLEIRGENIIKLLEDMDARSNMCKNGNRIRRKRVKPPNTVGGYVAQKIFKYHHDIIDSEPRTTIWRIQ